LLRGFFIFRPHLPRRNSPEMSELYARSLLHGFSGNRIDGRVCGMPRKTPADDDDNLPGMVPRNDKRLVPVAPARVQRLQQHLLGCLRELRMAKRIDHLASPAPPEPDGFHAVVARAACAICRGFCCQNGDDDAFLDNRTLARVRLAYPELTDDAIIRRYLDRVPSEAYRASCIFHAKKGCTLNRSMRADICNSYFCGGLSVYIKSGTAPEPTVVIAGDAEKMRVSPVLLPATL
jgi:hypothetical protein